LKAGWGILWNTWWALLKTRVSKPTSNPTQPPAKMRTPTPTKQNPLLRIVPLENEKLGEKRKNWWELGFCENGKKNKKMGAMRADGGGGAEVAVWWKWVWCGIGLRGCWVVWEMREEWGKECTAL
jgi:hypothetical protein